MINFTAFIDYWKSDSITAENCRETFLRTNPGIDAIKLKQYLESTIRKLLRRQLIGEILWCKILPAGFSYHIRPVVPPGPSKVKITATKYAYCMHDKTNRTIRDFNDYSNSTAETVCDMEGDIFMLPLFKADNNRQRDLLSHPTTFTLIVRDSQQSKLYYIDVDVFYARFLLNSKPLNTQMRNVVSRVAQLPGMFFPSTFASAKRIKTCKFTSAMSFMFDMRCFISWYHLRNNYAKIQYLVKQYVKIPYSNYLFHYNHFKMLLDCEVMTNYASGVGLWFDIGYLFFDPANQNTLLHAITILSSLCHDDNIIFYNPLTSNKLRLIHDEFLSYERNYLQVVKKLHNNRLLLMIDNILHNVSFTNI